MVNVPAQVFVRSRLEGLKLGALVWGHSVGEGHPVDGALGDPFRGHNYQKKLVKGARTSVVGYVIFDRCTGRQPNSDTSPNEFNWLNFLIKTSSSVFFFFIQNN
jgi:hypothetical protein